MTAATYNGKPCPLGHTLRYVSGGCVECTKARSGARYRADPVAHARYGKQWAANNRDKSRAIKRRWESRNASYMAGNKGEKDSRRRASKRASLCECCPPGLFRFVYWAAREAGNEVDHRLPLAMGGKHCVRNLQVLPPELHKAKTARDIAAIAAHRRDWLSANDSPDWAITKVFPDAETDLAGLASEILMANPELINKFEYQRFSCRN